jgi:hypothetical protein
MSKYVRLKRRDPKHGIVLRQYVYRGIRFLEARGWYIVDDDTAEYLESARQNPSDAGSPAAFDICTEAEARKIDEQESIEATPRRPADNARVTEARGTTSNVARAAEKKRRKKKRTAEASTKDESKSAESKTEDEAAKAEEEK